MTNLKLITFGIIIGLILGTTGSVYADDWRDWYPRRGGWDTPIPGPPALYEVQPPIFYNPCP